MTERWRCREAGLAGMNMATVFGRYAAEIELVAYKVRRISYDFFCLLREAVSFRYLPRACMLIARRAIDQENA